MLTHEELHERMVEWAAVDVDPGFEDALDDPTLIDAHAHCFPIRPTWGPGGTDVDTAVEVMDAHGVDRAVLLAEEQAEKPFVVPSWWVLERAAEYPERFVPFCVIDPRSIEGRRETIAELLSRYVDRGARGVGELKVGLAVDDDRMLALYELCADLDLPVLIHVDATHARDEVGLPRLEEVLASYPDVDVVAHSRGWWAHVSADVSEDEVDGYPDGPVEPGGRCGELLGAYDNLYADFSPSGFQAITRDLEHGQTFLERHHDSLLFGTDASYSGNPASFGEPIPHFAFFERFDLAPAAWEAIRHGNLERILR